MTRRIEDEGIESVICVDCNGSGEGWRDGSSCSACGGSGEITVLVDEDEESPDDDDES